MRSQKLLWTAAVVGILALQGAQTQSAPSRFAFGKGGAPSRVRSDVLPAGAEEKIQAAVRAEMEKQGIPGLSIAVVFGGSKALESGFGKSDVENDVEAKPSTVYRLGSISKCVTAVAAMRLVEQGKLSLEAKVRDLVPQWPEAHPDITIQQLLGHLGGVRHYRGSEIDSTRTYPSLTAALEIFRSDPLVARPGEKYAYTTYGYTLLGCAMETAAGKPFGQIVQDEVIAPAGLKGMRVDEVAAIIPGRAQGYERGPGNALRNSGLADTSYKIPGGGLCSTAGDLADFAAALMNGKLLKPETRDLMWTSLKTSDGVETRYGLGFGIGERNGFALISHSGSQQRVTTVLLMVPSKKLAVSVMTNLEGCNPTAIGRTILDILSPDLAPKGGKASIIKSSNGRSGSPRP